MNLPKLETIKLYKGATSIVEFDFSEFVFPEGSKCIFSMSKLCSDEILKTFEFSESKKYLCVFEDEFTATLDRELYRYNIIHIVGEDKYPQCSDSEITVERMLIPNEPNN